MLSWPSHSAMVEMSTPAWRRVMAALKHSGVHPGPRQSSEMSELVSVALSRRHRRAACDLRSGPARTRGTNWTNLDFAGPWVSTKPGQLQGRAGAGLLRGPLLVGLAPSRDAGVGRARLRHAGTAGPKSPCVGLTTFAVLRELQLLLTGWAGACPLCLRRLPRSTAWLHPSTAPT